jgi:hypothetical protein
LPTRSDLTPPSRPGSPRTPTLSRTRRPTCTTAGARTGYGLGPGDPCYEFNAQQYNDAFAAFFQRIADDGITPAHTLFVFAADEGDHFNGANAGRAMTPVCTGTPGVAVDTAAAGQTPTPARTRREPLERSTQISTVC